MARVLRNHEELNAWSTFLYDTTMIHADYLQHLLELAEQKFGVSAPETQELRKELEEARKLKPKPAKEQRYLVGFRKL